MSEKPNRRKVLKGIGAGATVLGGASVGATAEGSPEVRTLENKRAAKVVADYKNPDAIRATLEEHEDMLQELESQGLLESSKVDDLGVESLSSFDSEKKTESEEVVAKQVGDKITPEIVIGRKTSDGMLTIGIRPETGARYALINDAEDTGAEVLDYATSGFNCDDPCCDASCCPTGDCPPNTICACEDCCVDCSCGADPACWDYCV